MANPRDTRCISAAFDFLKTTDFCQRCAPGDQEHHHLHFDSDMNESPTDLMGVKKSESDTALLQCQDERREERRVVCLCAEKEGSCGLHQGYGGQRGSDFLQGYIDRYSLENLDAIEPGTGLSGDRGETDCCVTTRQEGEKADGCLAGKLENGDISLEKENGDVNQLNSSADKTGEKEPNCFQDVNASCKTITQNTVSSTTDNMGSENHIQTEDKYSSMTIDSLLRQDESCKEPDIPQQGSNNSVEESSSSSKTHTNQEDEDDEVVMRPNRKSLHRRSTDTAFISSAFDFLPSTDSVFLPSGRDSTAASSAKTDSVMSMPSIDECGSQNKHEGGCCDTVKDGGTNIVVSPRDRTDRNVITKSDAESPSNEDGDSARLRRRHLSKQDSVMEEEGSGDSSDEDAGVYSESFRRSNWMRIDDYGELELAFPAVNQSRLSSASRSSEASRSSTCSVDMTDRGQTPSPKVSSDEPPQIPSQSSSPRLYLFHKRSDSTSTTFSEKEFKKEYVTRRKCLIQRQNSSKEYHRFSASVYEEEKSMTLEKEEGEQDFGIHILDSQPAYITRVDPGSAADRAGVEEGQILVSVNGTNVLSSSHNDIVALIVSSPSAIQVAVATSDFQPSRDLQISLMEGHMQKLGGSSSVIMRRWKRRYFVLRQDSCLYYYKQKDDSDPLGAIPLAGYAFSRHLDSGKDFCFKAEKYGARTYFFMTDGRDTMTEWVGALSEAAARSKHRKESFVSVSSHNVGLPALDIRRPECTGYLLKVGNRRKTWHRRYCVLKDACLYYYKNMNSLSALGVAHLHGYKVDPSISISKKHAFALMPPVEALRVFQFSAENDTDRQRWVQAMIRSIQRWIQIDNDG